MVKNGTCGLCQGGCAVVYAIENGKIVKAEPDKESPKGAQLIGGPKASILSCAEPLSSALLSLLLLGITFTLPDWLGTLLILSSVILISMDSRRRARAA